jgi:hypothetical protein
MTKKPALAVFLFYLELLLQTLVNGKKKLSRLVYTTAVILREGELVSV